MRLAVGFARDQNAVEKQRDLGALAQHGDADDDGEREKAFLARRDGMAHRRQFARELASVTRHPDVVPGEHQHGEAEHAGVEQLLPASRERARKLLGESGDDERAQEARRRAGEDDGARSRDAARDRERDPDDQAGLDDLSKDDDERAEHVERLFDDEHALGGFLVIVAEESVFARGERRNAHGRLPLAGDDFLDVQRLALEFLGRRVEILDRQHDGLAGRRMQFGGLETMVLDLES